METAYDLYKKLHPELLKLDKERKRKLYFVIPVSLFCLILFLYLSGILDLLINGIPDFDSTGYDGWIINTTLTIGLFWVYSQLKNYRLEYERRFKSNIIQPILSSLADNVIHKHDDKFRSRDELTNSEFVSERPSGIDGEDLVTGEIAGIEFTFSEIDAYKNIKTSKGTNKETLLEGVFFMATFPKKLVI